MKCGSLEEKGQYVTNTFTTTCNYLVFVATLALGSRPRQRGCKGAGQREAQESHQGLPRV
jgi:hypothetical protein